MKLSKVVFLDRDGVINNAQIIKGRPYPPSCLEEVIVPSGLPDLLSRIKKLGYKLIVVTNQPDVARGTQSKYVVESINRFLKNSLNIDEIRVCYHDDIDNCECRKPKPGLLYIDKESIDYSNSFLVGDRKKDIVAGKLAGCKTIFIDYNYDEEKPTDSDFVVRSILDINKILGVKA